MFRRFFRSDSGSVAVFFSFALTGIAAATGVAVDYSNASNVRSTLQSALDSAMLMAGKDAIANGKVYAKADIIRLVQMNLPPAQQKLAENMTFSQTDMKMTATINSSVQNRFSSFVGVATTEIAAQASVPLGSTRLEVVLVLDSTASMLDLGKMDAMKTAATQLVDTIAASSAKTTETAFAVVPFATQVRTDVAAKTTDWIDFRKGQPNPAENTAEATWNGCVMDRDMPFNKSKNKPDKLKKNEKHPAQNCTWPDLQTILPLTTSAAAAKSKIQSLVATGDTNTTIGLAWGFNVVTPGNPLGDNAAPASQRPSRAIVFLTDGLNTVDRYWRSQAEMDADMATLCKDVATAGVRLFTVRVVAGNDALLKNCASSPSDYYTTDDPAGLNNIFKEIAGKLTRLRLSS
ncbi:MAG: vWA domain-containing protein [Beijerinckiaceae bacterium]